METHIQDWLKCHFKDAAVSGPDCKRVKFSDIVDEATTGFPLPVSSGALSHAIREEFPNSVNKRVGEKRHTYIYGIDKEDCPSPLEVALERNRDLEREVELLKQKIVVLENGSAQKLESQMQSLLRPDLLCYHGPDSIGHLEHFSLDTLIEECKVNAPDVLDLIKTLGNCSRHDDESDEHLQIATLRSTMALCTLLKCRSVKVLGLQLFITIMLIARATSKQVCIIHVHGMQL